MLYSPFFGLYAMSMASEIGSLTRENPARPLPKSRVFQVPARCFKYGPTPCRLVRCRPINKAWSAV